jgi:hypothetical protein
MLVRWGTTKCKSHDISPVSRTNVGGNLHRPKINQIHR